jgi:hypothetical protein
MRRTLTSVGLVAIAASVAVVCSGCLSGGAELSEPVSSRPSTPSASPVAVPAVEAGEVVATGEFTSPDDSFSGRVSVVSSGADDFELVYSDVSTSRSGLLATSFTTQPYNPVSYCAGSSVVLSEGELDLGASPTINFWQGDVMRQDPAFLDDVIVTQGYTSECGYTVLAVAPLTWTLPVMRPDIRPADSGTTGGANGEVMKETGDLLSYTVATDDLMTEVAARFGLSVDDLLYLNPLRTSGPERTLVDGETINLSLARR